MRDGRAGLGHPPWQGARGLRRVCKGGVGFLEGSERPHTANKSSNIWGPRLRPSV